MKENLVQPSKKSQNIMNMIVGWKFGKEVQNVFKNVEDRVVPAITSATIV